jgi:hypothetical protein
VAIAGHGIPADRHSRSPARLLARTIVARVDEAKLEKLLTERDPFTPSPF